MSVDARDLDLPRRRENVVVHGQKFFWAQASSWPPPASTAWSKSRPAYGSSSAKTKLIPSNPPRSPASRARSKVVQVSGSPVLAMEPFV